MQPVRAAHRRGASAAVRRLAAGGFSFVPDAGRVSADQSDLDADPLDTRYELGFVERHGWESGGVRTELFA